MKGIMAMAFAFLLLTGFAFAGYEEYYLDGEKLMADLSEDCHILEYKSYSGEGDSKTELPISERIKDREEIYGNMEITNYEIVTGTKTEETENVGIFPRDVITETIWGNSRIINEGRIEMSLSEYLYLIDEGIFNDIVSKVR